MNMTRKQGTLLASLAVSVVVVYCILGLGLAAMFGKPLGDWLARAQRPPPLETLGVAAWSGALMLDAPCVVWGWSDTCFPMSVRGETPPYCPAYLFLFNEPEGAEPWGHPVEPRAGAAASQALRAHCPRTWLIVGNNMQAGTAWLDEYIANGGQYDQLGTHCYIYGLAQTCIDLIENFIKHFPDTPICVTEWAVLRDENVAAEMPQFLDYLARVRCAFVFTDAMIGGEPWGKGIDPSLMKNGALTARGEIFVRYVQNLQSK